MVREGVSVVLAEPQEVSALVVAVAEASILGSRGGVGGVGGGSRSVGGGGLRLMRDIVVVGGAMRMPLRVY
jgi:hypothetical protein